jgi:hypothetical protein
MIRNAALVLAALLATVPAVANDSEAEIGIGGIVLRPSEALVMQSEDLFISEDAVRVTYRFLNPTDRDITTTVAFPMPAQPRAMLDLWYDMENKRDWSEFGFATWVDGKPVRLQMIERAMIGTSDVTERITELGFPIYWPDEYGDSDLFEKMPEAEQGRFIAEGLAVKDDDFSGRLVPAWDHVAYFVREQTFPADSTVEVRHEYSPLAGGSVGGALEKPIRESDPNIAEEYAKQYCTDDYFIAGLDRRLSEKRKPGVSAFYSETWLDYVLSSGANWKGPIGRFRLVIDKGSPDNLVSFCMDGVRKIAPTQFEVTKTNFEPQRDLDILIVKFHQIED